MRSALIGYTGFVGGTLLRQHAFDDLYRSTNIEDIRGRSYDLVVCAGASAAKWLANREPETDRACLDKLQQCLGQCLAHRVVLISTVDVYLDPRGVDETTPIDPANPQAYGRHRFLLERFVAEHFPSSHTLRLPALFGGGLKKNFLYDLLNANCLDWTHCDSLFQFYDMNRLWADCCQAMALNLPLVNLAVEPLCAGDVARVCFGFDFTNRTEKPPITYDMRSRHAALFGGESFYMIGARQTLSAISAFVASERRAAA